MFGVSRFCFWENKFVSINIQKSIKLWYRNVFKRITYLTKKTPTIFKSQLQLAIIIIFFGVQSTFRLFTCSILRLVYTETECKIVYLVAGTMFVPYVRPRPLGCHVDQTRAPPYIQWSKTHHRRKHTAFGIQQHEHNRWKHPISPWLWVCLSVSRWTPSKAHWTRTADRLKRYAKFSAKYVLQFFVVVNQGGGLKGWFFTVTPVVCRWSSRKSFNGLRNGVRIMI